MDFGPFSHTQHYFENDSTNGFRHFTAHDTMPVQRIQKLSSNRLLSLVLVCLCCVPTIAVRPLNSIQLATGEWDVSITGGFWADPSSIFPSLEQGGLVPVVEKRFWKNSMDCVLSMASDGTFVLTPKYVTLPDSPNAKEAYTTENHDRKTLTVEKDETPRLLDLRGSWNVLANPYCVTDRYYDQVSFSSYPRQQTTISRSDPDESEEQVLSQPPFQLVLNCRMWGRHKRQIKNKDTYRMTHGTLVCKDTDLPWWKHFGRPILGSFTAVRSSHEPKHRGWVDRDELGYSTD